MPNKGQHPCNFARYRYKRAAKIIGFAGNDTLVIYGPVNKFNGDYIAVQLFEDHLEILPSVPDYQKVKNELVLHEITLAGITAAIASLNEDQNYQWLRLVLHYRPEKTEDFTIS